MCLAYCSVAYTAPVIDFQGVTQNQAVSRDIQVQAAPLATSWAYHVPPAESCVQSPRSTATAQAAIVSKDQSAKHTSLVTFFALLFAFIKS